MNAFVNGTTIGYDDIGNGDPILLIHGFPLCRKLWKPQVNALSDNGFRIINPDLRGFGESDSPQAPYSMDIFADDLIDLLDTLEIEKTIVCGMSMGGYILLNMLDRYPDRISGAVFFQSRANADDEAGKMRRLELARKVRETGPQVVADAFVPMLFADESLSNRPKLVAQVRGWMMNSATAGIAGGLLAMREREDYTDKLKRFNVPSLAIGGEYDKLIERDVTLSFAENMQQCSCEFIAGAGHLANLESPNECNSVLLKFLSQLTGRNLKYSCCG